MAMYIKISIGDEDVSVFGVQRQETLVNIAREYTYLAKAYKKDPFVFRPSEAPEDLRIIRHTYSDGATVLAEKVLQAFNLKK